LDVQHPQRWTFTLTIFNFYTFDMASEGGDGAARLAAMAETWRSDLLTNVLPFWLKNSVDTECGGERTHTQLLQISVQPPLLFAPNPRRLFGALFHVW
jgi:hypothetical protein